MNSAPQNTAAASPLENMIVAASANGIEAQEARGQRELLESTVLPVEGSENPRLAELGFVFGDPVAGDPLFREATLPEGWTREGSDHAMHSYICDERGMRRVNVFYKAAFYDRRADMSVMSVGYSVATNWIYGDEDEVRTLSPLLTSEELASARAQAEGYIKESRDEVTGHIYADRVPHAKSLLAAIVDVTA